MGARVDMAAVFDASPNPYMLLDRELRYVDMNRAYLRATASTREELIGTKLIDRFPHDPEDPDNESARRLVASFERVFATGQPDVLPFIHYRIAVNGAYEDHYWSATHTPIFDADGKVELVLQHTVDVTDLHDQQRTPGEPAVAQVEAGVLSRAEQVQQRNEALDQEFRRLLRIFDQAPGFLCMLRGPHHVFELANAAYYDLVGGRDLIGKTVREAIPEIDASYFELLDGVFTRREPFVGRAMAIRLQKSPMGPVEEAYLDFIYQPIVDAHGTALGVFVLGSDVTQQVRAEAARAAAFLEAEAARQKLEIAQAELEAIFESFPEALYYGDETGMKRVNAAALEVLGYESPEQVLREHSKVVEEIAPRRADTGELVGANETPFARALAGHGSREELAIKDFRTREDKILYTSAAPVRVAGTVTGAVVTQIDVSQQKRAQTEALQLARVLDATRDFVGIANLEGRPLFVNEAGRHLMGLADLAAARRLQLIEYFVPRERAQVLAEVIPAALRDGYWEGELHFEHQQIGEEIPVRYTVFPLRDAGGTITALATITHDLRAQKTADAERTVLLENEKTAREQAEQANIVKDHFLATISHELRTPLTAILGWSQMLRSDMVPAHRREHALETIERNARAQAQLIEDLLDVSRIISGKLAIEMEPVDIAAVVSAAIETVRPVADAKGVGLDVMLESTIVTGDSGRLQQVLWNLLANAVKFTPGAGRVTLRVERRRPWVEITVTDTGAGISADFLPHVFERFRQAETGSARNIGGLGLGLSIVRYVVEAHCGEVAAFSAGRDQGATFTVRLPIAPQQSRTPVAPERAVDPPRALEGMRVLVVDDEEDTREYVRALLGHCKAQVTVAATAAEALVALERDRPDLLVSDLGMPSEDGYSLIRRVRALPNDRGGLTPAIALTAYARIEDRTKAMRAGFQNHVTKPVEPNELLAVVASLAPRH